MGYAEHERNLNTTADTTTGPSDAVWATCPIEQILANPKVGFGFFDDFSRGGLITSPTTSAALVGLPYSGFGSAGSTITYSAELGGGIVISETTDEEAVSIFSLETPFQMGLTGGDIWFEARIKPSHTATTEQAMFLGLADNTAKTVTVPLTATAGGLADLNLVGFHKLDTDLTSIKTVYKANTVTAVTLETVTSALTATTYVKLGFRVGADRVLRYYIDGVLQDTTFELTDDAGTDFPADVRMGPILAMHLGAGAADNTIIMDWWRCYQTRTDNV